MHVSVTRLSWRSRSVSSSCGVSSRVVVRDQIEDVLFQIGAGAADGVHLVAADHLGQRQTELGRAHGAGETDQHLTALVEVSAVALGAPRR
jgi:hypothetical protein